MSAGRTLYVNLVANVSTFHGQMLGAGRDVTAFGRIVDRTAQQNEAFRRGIANTALVTGGVLAAGMVAGVVAAARLERAMANVATISDTVRTNMRSYTDAIVEMSTEVPQSAESLAEGLYDVVSSGFDGADAMKILKTSATAASAGLTDTATASKVVLSALNAYGLSADHANEVSDILFQTVNKGVVSFPELAGSIGRVIPTAAAAGIPLEQLGSALAAITLSGLSAEESTTSLNQTINKIVDPGKDMSKALADIGYNSGTAALKALGLKGTIDALDKSQGHAADTALKLFPEIRAARGYMALTAAEGKNYASTFNGIASAVERAGATQKAFKTQQETTVAQFQQTKNVIAAIGIQAGQALLPMVNAGLSALRTFVDAWNSLPGPVKDAVTYLGLASAAVLLVGGGFLRASGQVTKFRAGLAVARAEMATTRTATTLTTVALKGMQAALGIVGLVLLAGTAIYGAYSAKKREATAVTDSFVEALRSEANGVKNAGLTEVVEQLDKSGGLERLKKAGLDAATVVRGITGDSKQWAAAQAEINGALDEAAPGLSTWEKKLSDAQEALSTATYGTDEYTKAQHDLAEANAAVAAANAGPDGDRIRAIQATTKEVADLRDRYGDAQEKVDLFSDANEKLAKSSTVAKSGLEQLEERAARLAKTDAQAADLQKKFGDALSGMQDPMNALSAASQEGEASLASFTKALEKQVSDAQSWVTNLAVLAARGRSGLVAQFQQMGPEAASVLADATKASDKELDHLSGLFRRKATQSTAAFQAGLDLLPRIAQSKGKATVGGLARGLNMSKGEVRAALREVRKDITDIPTRRRIDLILKGDRDAAKKAKSVALAAGQVKNKFTADMKVSGDKDARDKIKKTQRSANDLAKSYNLTVVAKTTAANTNIDSVQRNVDDLRDKTITITVQTVHKGGKASAMGGYYPGSAYAGGGIAGPTRVRVPGTESHRAQIAGAGSYRVFGEGETGGEAYIPLSSFKRTSAKAVLGQVADRFGMDLVGRGGGGGGGVTIIRQVMPGTMVLDVDGTKMTGFVRGHAADVSRDELAAHGRLVDSTRGMDWS